MLAILNKEFKSYFKSPVAYVFMAFYLVYTGIFFVQLVFNGYLDYSYVLGRAFMVMLLGLPLLTMRLLSEEKRTRTDQLILTSPVSTGSYVLGKYGAAVTLFAVTLGMTVLQPIALSTLGTVPWAQVIGVYVGMFLVGCVFIAIGLFVSSMTESQVVAAIASIALFLVLLFVGQLKTMIPAQSKASIIFLLVLILILCILIYNAIRNIIVTMAIAVGSGTITLIAYMVKPALFDGFAAKFFSWFSIVDRFTSSFILGILDISSMIYFLSFAAIFIFLTVQVVEKRRWS